MSRDTDATGLSQSMAGAATMRIATLHKTDSFHTPYFFYCSASRDDMSRDTDATGLSQSMAGAATMRIATLHKTDSFHTPAAGRTIRAYHSYWQENNGRSCCGRNTDRK
jgi:hypothetical protein